MIAQAISLRSKAVSTIPEVFADVAGEYARFRVEAANIIHETKLL